MFKRVGFFRELRHGDMDGPSLKIKKGHNYSNLNDILYYLNNGQITAVAPGYSIDVLKAGKKIIGPLAILNDGVWEWPSDLAYYIEQYWVELPVEFLEHMKNMDWKVLSH